MKRSFKLLTLLSIFVLFLVGCTMEGENKGTDSAVPKDGDQVIGLSISTTNNPFFVDLQKGVTEAAKEQGMSVKVVDAQDDTATQLNGMDDLIQQGVDIILVNPVDSDAIAPAVESANDAGIPVIAIDRSSAGGEILSFIASDNVEGGKMAAEFIVEQIGEDGKAVQLEGIPGSSSANERGEGFMKGAEGKLDIVASQTANYNRAEGLTLMEDLLQTHSDIQAVFAQNDEMALGAFEAIKAAGKENDIIVVGFDGNDDALKSIEDKEMTATIAQQPVEMGRLAVQAAKDHFDGNEPDAEIPSPLKLVK